tara:strand:+ start:643 stop:1965 length:1323 start_codon:yes stop_codon:yes gene_type:complete
MRKIFWSFMAVLLAAMFLGIPTIQAADISFGGQILNRAERVDTNEDGSAADWQIGERLRLNTTAKAGGVTGFAQLQWVHAWGNNTWINGATGVDADQAAGVHQAHITVPNFYGSGWNLKLGRQEIVLDGHRLFGHTGWHLNAVTHDAAVLINPAWDLTYAYSFGVEDDSDGDSVAEDAVFHVFRKGLSVAGGKTALYFVAADDATGSDALVWYTAGVRQAGKAAGYDYRVEVYHQFGEFAPLATGAGTWASSTGEHGADMDAWMFGARLGKKVNKTKVTLWYDYLSGNDDSDANNNSWGAFHTIADTGHKFYGLIDQFLPRAGNNTDFLGIQDAAIKLVHPVSPGWTLKGDYHRFWTAEDPGDNLTAWVGESVGTANGCECAEMYLGEEIDLTLKHKYSSNLAIQFGYSWFSGTETYMNIAGRAVADDKHWAYAQANFTF